MTDTAIVAASKRKLFIDVLRATCSVKHAATTAGLYSNNLYQERKTNIELAEAWDAALDEFAGRFDQELIDAAIGAGRWNKPDIRGVIEIVRAMSPDRYRPKTEHTTIVNVGQDYETHIPAPAQRPVIEAEGRPVTPPRALQSTETDEES
jgi:hypothetical protein